MLCVNELCVYLILIFISFAGTLVLPRCGGACVCVYHLKRCKTSNLSRGHGSCFPSHANEATGFSRKEMWTHISVPALIYIWFSFFCCGTGLSQEPLHRCFCSHCKWFWPHFPTVTVRFSQSDPPFWHFYLLSGVKGLLLHDRCTLATQFAMTIPSKCVTHVGIRHGGMSPTWEYLSR